jgi:hypothetical protein
MDVKSRVKAFLESKNITIQDFEKNCKLSNGYINSMRKGFGIDKLDNVLIAYPELSKDWLLKGEGEMLKSIENERVGNKLIPFYDDVTSIGGNSSVSNVDSISSPSEYVDAGDWFKDATAAIRHYGDSMDEYPSGCILALKEVYDRDLIIPGRDYMIETSEYRVTKRVQKGNTPEFITAYSTNTDTYPDGRMVHEPFDIPFRAISRISMVLGYVVKKNGGTMVFNKNGK